MTRKFTLCASVCSLALLTASPAFAFCGFYVSGATEELFNNATQVVMMREGTRTVLSMQNNYQGPPEDFAMVIPVPEVLQKENVKTLPKSVFQKVDQMAAPRLVEYWEQDPCAPVLEYERRLFRGGTKTLQKLKTKNENQTPLVKIEAQFEVGEYEIVILSAKDSNALNDWLLANKYKIPKGAEPVLRPYVEQGTKFFVARVNAKKVQFEDGEAALSPLRFHYDSKNFNLPIRLGLLNANGPQDLIVHILAKERYEASNYNNIPIPTNIRVDDKVKKEFPAFYASLFDETLRQNPGSVVTEYAWDASTCDPCPGPTLRPKDFMTLGADVLPSKPQWGLTLTRIHARYTQENLGEDLVFKAAPAMHGGRGTPNPKGIFAEKGATVHKAGRNNFQGRYAILHPWEGKVACEKPNRGRWGGPLTPDPNHRPAQAAKNLAKAPRGSFKLASAIKQDVPELKFKENGAFPGKPAPKSSKLQKTTQKPAQKPAPTPAQNHTPEDKNTPNTAEQGCSVTSTSPHTPKDPTWWLAAALGALWLRRKKTT